MTAFAANKAKTILVQTANTEDAFELDSRTDLQVVAVAESIDLIART